MTRDQLQACTKQEADRVGPSHHVVGWHGMRKDELVKVLETRKLGRRQAAKAALGRSPSRAGRRRPQHLRDGQPRRRCRTQQIRRRRADQGPVGQGAQGPAGRLRQGPHRRHGARPLLAALLLGTDAARHPAGRGRPRPGMAQRQADPARARREQPRHDQHRPKRRSATSTSTAAATTGTSTSATRRAPTASTSATSPSSGRFYVLARSNVVTTPRAGVSDVIDENWADIDAKKADRIYAMSGGFDPTGVQQPGTEAAVRGAAAPAAALAGRHQLRLRRPDAGRRSRGSSGSSSTPN